MSGADTETAVVEQARYFGGADALVGGHQKPDASSAAAPAGGLPANRSLELNWRQRN